MERFPAARPDSGDAACKLTIIIPVYNEAATFSTLLDEVRALDVAKEIIVVDNVSTDGTRELVAALDGEPGIVSVLQSANHGKGSSVRVGLALARGEWVVVQDADLEYTPEDILRLLAEAEARGLDAVFGSRLLDARPDVPWHHALGRDALNLLFRLLYGARMTDVATCYKLMRRGVAQDLVLDSLGFDLDYEIPCRLRRGGVTIAEVPVQYDPRTLETGKKLRWTDGLVALRAILRYRRRMRDLDTPPAVGDLLTLTAPPFGPREATVVRVERTHVVAEFELAGRTARVAIRPGPGPASRVAVAPRSAAREATDPPAQPAPS
ncbi:MAG: glycosyltransferase family 2 protein [Armatimonadetes bacterium]|nr:glycosyltransferase family 2 protein [Armatimonadota bacterium]